MRSPTLNLASSGLSSNLRAHCWALACIPNVDALHKDIPAGAGLPQKNMFLWKYLPLPNFDM